MAEIMGRLNETKLLVERETSVGQIQKAALFRPPILHGMAVGPRPRRQAFFIVSAMILREEHWPEAAHFIYNHPEQVLNPHGHSYKLFVPLEGQVNAETGTIIDFDDLSKVVVEKVISKLDHRFSRPDPTLHRREHLGVDLGNS
ncbi:MAG: 6-carboxytetrahydropterin synthase [Holophagaceae bacterium]|nr:6-carboxytetrahydropterin synthase [Holophagaceae bacterium]